MTTSSLLSGESAESSRADQRPADAWDGVQSATDTTIEDLLLEASTAEPARRARIHAKVVAQSLDLARSLAMRYRDRGEPLDDLIQVANTGLVLAVQRFKPTMGARFISFATPTILGELRRYFRDQCWAIRPPRRVQETLPRIRAAAAELQQQHAHQPTVGEVATHLALTEAEVLAIETAARHYNLVSLDGVVGPDGQTESPQVPTAECQIDGALTRMAVQAILSSLTDREHEIIRLRFFECQTQQQIADRIGVSQMQVSRLLKGILRRLRAQTDDRDQPLLSA